MIGALVDPFLENEFLVRALVAGVLVAVACAVVGTYVVLRGLAFLQLADGQVKRVGMALLHQGQLQAVRQASAARLPQEHLGARIDPTGDRLDKPPSRLLVHALDIHHDRSVPRRVVVADAPDLAIRFTGRTPSWRIALLSSQAQDVGTILRQRCCAGGLSQAARVGGRALPL